MKRMKGLLGVGLAGHRGGIRARTRRGQSGMQRPDRGQRHAHRGHELHRLCHAWLAALREHDAELRRIHHHRAGPVPAKRGLDRPLWAPGEQRRWHQGRVLQRDRPMSGGLYFSGVHNGFVKHSNFYGNTRYGANLAGPDSYGMQFDSQYLPLQRRRGSPHQRTDEQWPDQAEPVHQLHAPTTTSARASTS